MMGKKCMPMQHGPRILLSLLFIVGGYGFLTKFSDTSGMVFAGLSPWGLGGIAVVATVIAIVLKLGGGLMLLANYKTSTAAWMLIVFTVLATLMFHMHWNGVGGQDALTQFLKNLAIVGGLMLFACCPCPTCKAACKEGDCKDGDSCCGGGSCETKH
jgi:putative oxidoreductase